MTVLSRSLRDPHMMTVQCDLCGLPLIITNTEETISSLGWRLSKAEAGYDACPSCRHAHDGRTPGMLRRRGWTPPRETGRLPDVLIIGAAKAGTTSMHLYLDAHPDIHMSPLKELRFFSDPNCLSWVDTYRDLLASDAAVVGESSTMYTRSPAVPGTAERIAELVPDVRIVYLIREPVERALASYVEERFHGLEPRSVAEAFDDIEDPYNPYVAGSRYAEQLAPFLERFPRENIRVLPLEDLAADTGKEVRRLYEFLGVDPDVDVDLSVRANQRAEKFEYRGVAGKLRRSSAGHTLRRLPEPIRHRVTMPARHLLTSPIETPALSAEQLRRLCAAIAPDAARLRELTGLELASWSV